MTDKIWKIGRLSRDIVTEKVDGTGRIAEMRRLKISVTDNDIGSKFSCPCPVEMAISRTLDLDPWKFNITATPEEILVDNGTYRSPRSVRRFISAYDAGSKVKPFSFFLIPMERA